MSAVNDHIDELVHEARSGLFDEQPNRQGSYTVAVYDVDRRFGGPEEGGWWFDQGELVRVVKVFRREKAADDYARRLNDRLRSRQFGPNTGRPQISSVLSEGEYQAIVNEKSAPAVWPDYTPRYE